MNAVQAVSPDDQNVVELTESPGRRLRVQRQSKGWEIGRVATQLHLRPHLVEALEQDHFEDLPGPVFVIGYLRNYARLLGLDPEPLIGAYRAANPSPEPVAPLIRATGSPKPEIGGGRSPVRLIGLGLLLAVIALLVLWWQSRPESLPEPSAESDPATLPLLPLEEPTGDRLDLDNSETADTLPDSFGDEEVPEAAHPLPLAEADAGLVLPALPSQAPDSDSGPAEIAEPGAGSAEPQPESAAEATPGQIETPAEVEGDRPKVPEVVLSFAGTSWVDVRDAAGKVILIGEMRKGDRRVLKGDPPYSLVIGNSVAASVNVGDKSLDLSTKGRGGVARFKLDPSNPE
ncbi:MAG: RodZ domain-containing protein [Chromatiaceae bacterium]